MLCLIISACSGSGSGTGSGTGANVDPVPDTGTGTGAEVPVDPLIEDATSSEPEPAILEQLRNDPTLIAPVPEVVHTETLADTGIQVSYTDTSLILLAPSTLIEQQWVFMQNCLEQVSVAPLVIVRQDDAVPITPADDVVRNESALSPEINSVPIASASTLFGPVIQVSGSDFDGSLGSPAFNLRSIMGRHIWLSNNLPERDYPFDCARQEP